MWSLSFSNCTTKSTMAASQLNYLAPVECQFSIWGSFTVHVHHIVKKMATQIMLVV